MSKPSDPAAFIFDMLSQWDKASGESRTDGATAGFRQMIDRALAAANMPGKGDLTDIADRLSRVEGALFRIEGALADLKALVPKDTPSTKTTPTD